MDQIISVIQAILSGVKSPFKAGIGALLALFFWIFISVSKGKFRDAKADAEKDEQKVESNNDLENSNAEGEDSVRDQLERRNQV